MTDQVNKVIPTLHFLSAGAAKGIVSQLMQPFAKENGYQFSGDFGAVGLMRDKFNNGDPCDLLILSEKHIREMTADGLINQTDTRPLGVVRTGVAKRSGEPDINVTDENSFKDCLINAPEIYFPDQFKSTAGIHFANVMRTLGVYEKLQDRFKTFPNGATAMRAMANEGKQGAIGCTQSTEILYTDGVDLVATLPKRFELATIYMVTIPVKNTEKRAITKKFIELLTGPETTSLRTKGGFYLD